jgi:hypothetical protein
MRVITMSREELTRLRVLIGIADGRLSVAAATALIRVGRRQIYRLRDAFRAGGSDGLISRKRGRPRNRALGAVFRETALSIMRGRYARFWSEMDGYDGRNGTNAIVAIICHIKPDLSTWNVPNTRICAGSDQKGAEKEPSLEEPVRSCFPS